MIISVSELNGYVKEYLEANPYFKDLFIKGEISNFKHHSMGHMYFTLKDEKSAVRAVMFKFHAINLDFEPENGMNVIVCARVSLFERDGAYQLYVSEIHPDGVGALYLRYEQLKDKLHKEGLFDDSHKKKIPEFPSKIGVVTSKSGAAVRDIINVIKRRCPIVDIFIYPAQVQGENAYREIISGIRYFNENKVDTIIIGRGGGSIEDLWNFNEEELAFEIYNSEVPVISAVGHETDYTISDFVSDLRAPTPSAAAEMCVPDIKELIGNIDKTYSMLANSLLGNLRIKKEKYNKLISSRAFAEPDKILFNKTEYFLSLCDKMTGRYKNSISFHKEKFVKLSAALDSLSPLKILSRGYTFVEDEKNHVVSGVSDIKEKDRLKLRFSDGEAICEVQERRKYNG